MWRKNSRLVSSAVTELPQRIYDRAECRRPVSRTCKVPDVLQQDYGRPRALVLQDSRHIPEQGAPRLRYAALEPGLRERLAWKPCGQDIRMRHVDQVSHESRIGQFDDVVTYFEFVDALERRRIPLSERTQPVVVIYLFSVRVNFACEDPLPSCGVQGSVEAADTGE